MRDLDSQELECLQRIANGYPEFISPCADHVLENLMNLGLIERSSSIWLPLEVMRDSFQVTSSGRKYLQRLDN